MNPIGTSEELANIAEYLKKEFEVKDLGKTKLCLGIELEHKNNGILIHQSAYTKRVLKKFNMENSNSLSTLMVVRNLDLEKDLFRPKEFNEEVLGPEVPYLNAIGALISEPTRRHWNGVKHILRYLRGTADLGLFYSKNSTNQGSDTFRLSSFTNEDWAGDENDRHSTSGYCFNTGSTMVSWYNKKQSVVGLSSTEAEYVAATMAAQECIWLNSSLGDLFCKDEYSVKIKCDNESAIELASNPVVHGRTKHIEIHHNYFREDVLNQESELEGVATSEQVAYICTKALAKPKFEYFTAALGVVNRKHALSRSVEN
ncbi:hypothetical protein ABFS83_06G156000 [Erythranthe nasuta]